MDGWELAQLIEERKAMLEARYRSRIAARKADADQLRRATRRRAEPRVEQDAPVSWFEATRKLLRNERMLVDVDIPVHHDYYDA